MRGAARVQRQRGDGGVGGGGRVGGGVQHARQASPRVGAPGLQRRALAHRLLRQAQPAQPVVRLAWTATTDQTVFSLHVDR